MAMGIFLAWLNLLLFLRLVPVVGIFVLMFTVVLKSFLKFSVVFFLFIVAFTFGFHTLLVNHIAFSEVGMSLLKTFVMMLGEFEYQSTFIEGDQVGQSDPVILFSFVTYIMFPTFLIVMTILIMNLLIGLAVDDIKSVQNEATLNRRVMQIKLILDIESVLAPYPNVLANRWFGLQQHRVVKCFLSTVKRLKRIVFGKTLHLEMVTEKQRQLPARGEHLYLKRTQMSSCGIHSSAESLSKEQSCRMD
ncbi:unnamed protein product [Dicrocoelium dendriticum]|nr:unnamed protein product [Dicrocoelium dendriticum]